MNRNAGSIIAVVAVISGIACDGRSFCSGRVLEEVDSPERSHTAVILERSCGATTGMGIGVSLIEHGEAPDSVAFPNVYFGTYVADQARGGSTEDVPSALDIEWASDSILVVFDDPHVDVIFQAIRQRGVIIEYRQR